MNDIFAEMEADALDPTTIPSDVNLAGLAGLVQEQLRLEEQVAKTDDLLKSLKADLLKHQTLTLPEAMMELNVQEWTTTDGDKVKCEPFVGAHISAAKKDDAHTWLRNNNFADLIKVKTTVDTGRDLDSLDNLKTVLIDAGYDSSTVEGVHNGTLKVWGREQVTAGVPIPLERFGAYLGQKTTIKKGT